MNRMVALTLMHVVGFKMPVNVIFGVEFEGLWLCAQKGPGSSLPDLAVKIKISMSSGHSADGLWTQDCCRIQHFLPLLWLSFTEPNCVSQINQVSSQEST